MENYTSAIIVAAGSSRRMGGVNKLLLKIGGKTVLERTVEVFDKSAYINEIIIAARAEDIDEYRVMLQTYQKVRKIVPGGQTRQQSVAAAVAACSSDCAFLAIHDGARPLVTGKIISDTLTAAYSCGAAASGVHVKDTIKQTDENSIIVSTPVRASLWAAHTPQCFGKKLYDECTKKLGDSAAELTDDCRLIEECGGKVMMVEGSYSNIKVTTAEDILLAEKLLERMERE